MALVEREKSKKNVKTEVKKQNSTKNKAPRPAKLISCMDDDYFMYNEESINRQKSALMEDFSIINKENGFYIINSGENTYKTNLEKCSCRDFVCTKITCKHMYLIAHSEQVFNLFWGFKWNEDNQNKVDMIDNATNNELYKDYEKIYNSRFNWIKNRKLNLKNFKSRITPKKILFPN